MVCDIKLSGKTFLRFVAKLRVGEGCWQWCGSLARRGYGSFWLNGRYEMAHRIAYAHFKGPVPAGLVLDHICRNRGCVNPAHLEPVTMKENVLRGEGLTARSARQTHCKNGHELFGANLYLNPGPYGVCRVCRTCKSARRLPHGI